MKKPHKHAELIKKWADDDSLKIEFKSEGQAAWIEASYPSWDKNTEYRIKPEVIRYRVALLQSKLLIARNLNEQNTIEDMSYFIKWLTDWTEVEI